MLQLWFAFFLCGFCRVVGGYRQLTLFIDLLKKKIGGKKKEGGIWRKNKIRPCKRFPSLYSPDRCVILLATCCVAFLLLNVIDPPLPESRGKNTSLGALEPRLLLLLSVTQRDSLGSDFSVPSAWSFLLAAVAGLTFWKLLGGLKILCCCAV